MLTVDAEHRWGAAIWVRGRTLPRLHLRRGFPPYPAERPTQDMYHGRCAGSASWHRSAVSAGSISPSCRRGLTPWPFLPLFRLADASVG
jgi:hypothetical protein